MPVYEFQCSSCGVMERQLPMHRSQEAQNCPHCQQPALRIIASAPRLSTSRTASARAEGINERARNEPLRSGKHDANAALADRQGSRKHPPGCGCCGSGASRTRTHADQSKSFPGSRPWMISH